MAATGNSPWKVLIAEAGATLAPYVQALRAEGYATLEVSSGAVALERIQQGDADVALVEDDLADQSALEVLRACARRVPIILCAASWNVTRAVQAMKAGAWDYLPRPIHTRDLLQSVASACQNRPDRPALDKLEARRRQAQKMELFGRLAGGVIHDFNNLLTVILGYCDVLKTNLAADHPLRKFVNEIDNVAVNGSALTHQLLAFSRNQVMEPRPVNLNALLTQMEAMVARLIGEHISVVVTPGKDLGLVRAVPNQLEQVILNLIVNARDAMDQGGVLALHTANIDLAGAAPPLVPGPYVLLQIADTGCGMDEHTKAHLFEPFFTTKSEGEGTGLGLSIVSSILHAASGHITVDSQLGQGTTFTIYLPRLAETTAGPHLTTQRAATGASS